MTDIQSALDLLRMKDKAAQILKSAAWVDTPESRKFLKTVQKYGLTPQAWERMGLAQDWKCAACGAFTDDGSHLRIDHCHRTGIVRGLLCHSCNIALGWSRDNPKTLRRLAAYLESVAPKKANDA